MVHLSFYLWKEGKVGKVVDQNSHIKSDVAMVQLNENTNMCDQAFWFALE